MTKNFCALCQKKLGGLWIGSGVPINNSSIALIPAYYDVFPKSPHKHFSIGDRYICALCEEPIVQLFGCTVKCEGFLDKNVVGDSASDTQIANALQYVEKYISTLPSGNEKDFFLYALSMPGKIAEFRNTLPIRMQSMQDELLSLVNKHKAKMSSIISKIESQNQSVSSAFYTFGIVDANLLFANQTTASLNNNISKYEDMTKDIICWLKENRTFNYQENFDYRVLKQTLEIIDEQIKDISVPLNKIKHFKMFGNIGYSSNVHGGGGGGGGINTQGAVVGGLLFGGAGAIIGSQMGTEIHIDPIKTDIKKHDDRKVEFFYEDENGKTVSLEFDSSAYECLMKLIPEKAFDSVVTEIPKKEEDKTPLNTSLSQLKELKELLDLSIITQEEFDTKKKQLLGL